MNKKGFTLVELLATLVILGILMMFAVPTVLQTLTNHRSDTYLEDGKKFMTNVDYILKTNTKVSKPANGRCIAMSLEYIQSNDFENAPNGGDYDKEKSFVIVKNNSSTYEYYVRLVEKLKTSKESYKGIKMSNRKELTGDKARSKVDGIIPSDLFITNDSNISKISESLTKGGYSSCTIDDVYYLES